MKISKVFLGALLMVATATTSLSAQPGGGMRGGQHPGGGMQGGERPQGGMMMMDPVKMSGYFMFDADEAIKKSKVKSNDTKAAMNKAFAAFDKSYDSVSIECTDEIKFMEGFKDQMNSIRESQDRTTMRSLMMDMREKSGIVRPKMVSIHRKLDADLKEVLTVKEYEKWSSYRNAEYKKCGFTTKDHKGGRKGQHPHKRGSQNKRPQGKQQQ